MYRKLRGLLLIGLFAPVVLTGCSSLDNKGKSPPNNPPQIHFANIPVDGSTFSVNPIIYWYGTDNDGTIEQYQYAVRRETDVLAYLQSHGITGTAPAAELFVQHAPDEEYGWITIWVDSVQTATRGAVRLYASFDTNFIVQIDEACSPPCTTYLIDCEIDSVGIRVIGEDTVVVYDTLNCVSKSIQQYMFVRAVDDDNAISNVRYREFLRNNHWPQTKIENQSSFAAGIYYNIPRPKVTFAGIPVSWSASDSADFPRNQPEFEYLWRLYGPFGTRQEADTISAKLVMDSGDSLVTDGWIRKPSGIWTLTKTATLIDLWRRQPPSDTTRTGFFLFEVRARDDAFAEDPSPSLAVFEAIDAKLERRLLFIDDCNYVDTQEPLTAMGSGDAADGPPDDNLLRNRIFAILRDATNGAIDLNAAARDYYRRVNGDPDNPARILQAKMLAKYALLLVVDDDAVSPIDAAEQSWLAGYMNIGGKVWVFGRNSFLADNKNPNQFPVPTLWPCGATAGFYFDAEQMYLAAWKIQSLRPIAVPPEFIEGFDDFIGATPTVALAADFPTLNVDTNFTKDYFIHPEVRRLIKAESFRFKTIPDANFIVLGTGAEPIYTYFSKYAGTAFPHEKVCAIRYIGPSELMPVFKSAWFSFSPYGIKHQQMVQVFQGMLAWFEEALD